MTVNYDQKGKFFTPVVTKDPTAMIVQTLVHRIEGNFYTLPDDRVSDAINSSEQFISLTDVSIWNSQGVKILDTAFLVVNRDQVVWMCPTDDKKAI